MRKFVLILCATLCLVFSVVKFNAVSLLDFNDGELFLQLTPVYNGELLKVETESEFNQITKNKTVYGITYKTSGDEKKALNVLSQLKGEIVSTRDHGRFKEIVAYSDKIQSLDGTGGNNIQIIIKNNQIIVGIPAVLGCY